MSNHVSNQDIANLHQPKAGAAGKGCLTRCNGQGRGRDKDNLCSHIWQATEKAKDYPEMYNYPAYKSLCGEGVFETAARISSKGNRFPNNYAMQHMYPFRKKPKPGQWDIGIKSNFDHFLKPWWHNAHHIIPNSTFNNAITTVAEGNGQVRNLIRGGLLMGEYNLNDKVNMVILPMDQEVGCSIGLPRHLKGHQSGGTPQYFNHPNYNAQVSARIMPLMYKFQGQAQQAVEDHPAPLKKIAADKLDDISEEIFDQIRLKGAYLAGQSLDELNLTSGPR